MSRFPGWTCFADQQPVVGSYIIGQAGSQDDQVWHAVPGSWDGHQWLNQYGRPIPSVKPERFFYKETA